MAELEGHDGNSYEQLWASLLDAYRQIRELRGQVDALAELAFDAVRDLEDTPKGSWYSKRLHALGIGVER